MSFYTFRGDEQGFTIAFYGQPKRQFGPFAEGYRNAANLLANSLLARPHYPDYDAYPLVFLYRHALELALKNVIYESARIGLFMNAEGIDHALYNHHDLTKLCALAQKLVNLIFPERIDGLHVLMEECAKAAREFHEIDPASFSFRYPIDRQGEYPTPRDLSLAIKPIAERMDSLLEGLDTLDFGLQLEERRAQAVYQLLEDFLNRNA